jgi:ribonuclease HI
MGEGSREVDAARPSRSRSRPPGKPISSDAHPPSPIPHPPRRAAAPPLVAVYADESCLGNGRLGDNAGGAAGLIEYQRSSGSRLVRRDYWLSEPSTTNNRMALRSAIEALRILSAKGRPCRIIFISDSQYLVKGMREWLHGWITRNWRRKEGILENEALWREAADLVRRHEAEWRWVRGHHGHPQNEYSNDLAVNAARQQSRSDGAVPSGFDAWLAEQRLKKRVTMEPDPFPDAAEFRPTRALPLSPATRL